MTASHYLLGSHPHDIISRNTKKLDAISTLLTSTDQEGWTANSNFAEGLYFLLADVAEQNRFALELLQKQEGGE